MRAARGRGPVGLALAAVAGLVLASSPPALAAPVAPQSYQGAPYTSQMLRPPTSEANQSKLWFHAGAWWGLMAENTGRVVRVHELMPDHTWRPTSAVVNADAFDAGDAAPDGDTVHVTSRQSNGWLTYVRLRFDPAARDYTATAPVLVSDKGLRAPADIVKDTTGRLWISLDTAAGLQVITSGDAGQTWSASNTLGDITTGSSSESAALVAYDNRVGILWSNPLTGSFEFAYHRDGEDPLIWTRETARTGTRVGDHTSLKRVDGENGDTLVAAVTLAPADVGAPPDTVMTELLVRTPDGRWSSTPVSTVADGLDQPTLAVDVTSRTLNLLAVQDDDVVVKQASLDDLQFPQGPGKVFLQGGKGRMYFPTTTKEPVSARTGLVVLASDQGALRYRHAEAAIPSPEPVADASDQSAPAPPPILRGRAADPSTTLLSWAEAVDAERWAPARDGVPAAQYVVLRNGTEIATVTGTVFEDEPRGDSPATRERWIDYQVVAVDAAGNRSEPAEVVVKLPAVTEEKDPSAIGWSLLALATVCGALALVRPLRRARANAVLADPDPVEPVEERRPEPAGQQ